MNTSQTFTKHIRWDKVDYSKTKGATPDDRSPGLQRLHDVNEKRQEKLRMSFDNCLTKAKRTKYTDFTLSPNRAAMHPFHHSYVAGDKQHIADLVFEGGFRSPRQPVQLVPLINPMVDDSHMPVPTIDRRLGTTLKKLNEQVKNMEKEFHVTEREFTRTDSTFDPETVLAIYNET